MTGGPSPKVDQNIFNKKLGGFRGNLLLYLHPKIKPLRDGNKLPENRAVLQVC